jgi:hypothetical protein
LKYRTIISTISNSDKLNNPNTFLKSFFQNLNNFTIAVGKLVEKVPSKIKELVKNGAKEVAFQKQLERPEICLVRSVATFFRDLWDIEDRYLVTRAACKFVERLSTTDPSKVRQIWICRFEALKIYIESPHFLSFVLAYSPYFATINSTFKGHSLPWRQYCDHSVAHMLVLNCWGCIVCQGKCCDERVNFNLLFGDAQGENTSKRRNLSLLPQINVIGESLVKVKKFKKKKTFHLC